MRPSPNTLKIDRVHRLGNTRVVVPGKTDDDRMTWIRRFFLDFIEWYGQLSMPRQLMLGFALLIVVVPILMALLTIVWEIVARFRRTRRR